MDTISIAGGALIAVALGMALLTSRDKPQPIPCVYCGALLSPPQYRCNHNLGDGRGRA